MNRLDGTRVFAKAREAFIAAHLHLRPRDWLTRYWDGEPADAAWKLAWYAHAAGGPQPRTLAGGQQ